MPISLTDLSYDGAQDPVAANMDFQLKLSLFGATDDVPATVKFWTPEAYAVVPAAVNVTIPSGQTEFDKLVTVQLRGTAQPGLVRIYAECDERHSVFVEVR